MEKQELNAQLIERKNNELYIMNKQNIKWNISKYQSKIYKNRLTFSGSNKTVP